MNDSGLDETTIETLRSVLADHSVSFAMLFGSGARASMSDHSDVDVAIEFDDYRPGDEGYSDAYLRVRSALETALPVSVDVVDVHSMTPRFAHVAFEDGVVLRGTEARKDELADTDAGEAPTLADARERVSTAVERLQDGSVG